MAFDKTFALGPFDSDQNLIVNPEGTLLFAVNSGSNTIAVFHITGTALEPVEGSPFPSGGSDPVSLGLTGKILTDRARRGDDSVLAHAYFADKDPIGQSLNIPHWGVSRIIGVVAHVKHWGLGDQQNYTDNQIYASLYRLPDEWASFFYQNVTVTVRANLDWDTVLPAIKAAVSGAGSDQPVYSMRTIEEMVSQSMSTQRFPMILLATFAGLALLMASIGIYGLISYAVVQRVPEIGVRMALGAKKSDIFRMVIGQGLRLGLAGLAVGGAVAQVLTRVLSSFSHLLYRVGANDPTTFAAVSVVLIGVVFLACYIPARRAANVDPIMALRHE